MNILPRAKQTAVIAALSEGTSIRATKRLTGIHRDTIMRLGAKIGHGCAIVMDSLMRDLPSQIIQLDELWSFVGKKQKRLKPTDPADLDDCYVFVAMDSIHKAILSHLVGKRDNDTADELMADLRSRVLGSPIISSDGFEPYVGAVAMASGENVHYGQTVKHYNGEPATTAARRYSLTVAAATHGAPAMRTPAGRQPAQPRRTRPRRSRYARRDSVRRSR